MNKIYTVLLIVIIVAMSAVLTVPWKEKKYPFSVEGSVSHTGSSIYQMDMNENRYVSVETVASIFGWKKEYQSVVPKKGIQVKLEMAEWIKPLGFVKGSDDRKYYFMKDTRGNNIMVIAEGNTDNGWKLIKIENDHFVLEYEGMKYIVMMN